MRNTRPTRLLSIWPSHIRGALRAITLNVWAMALTVLGWALIWATALNLVPLVPVSAAVLMFLSGLALIPFGARRTSRWSGPRQTYIGRKRR
jgi:hypothetical protein